jgi:RNA polymerase sigma-70 factor (ECF subfamily)
MDIAAIFQAHKNDVFRFALSFVRDTALAEDITQDVFLSLINSREVIAKPKPWLMTCTRNTALNLLKKRSFEFTADEIPVTAVSDDAMKNLEFFEMLDCLSSTDRQIVTLHIVNRIRHSEIAQLLGLKAGTVRQRYVRALKTIKEDMLK